MQALAASGEHGLLELIMATHAGNTTKEFSQTVKDWLRVARHPKFKRPYTELVYLPMLELLAYLRANEFKTFIVSGGGIYPNYLKVQDFNFINTSITMGCIILFLHLEV